MNAMLDKSPIPMAVRLDEAVSGPQCPCSSWIHHLSRGLQRCCDGGHRLNASNAEGDRSRCFIAAPEDFVGLFEECEGGYRSLVWHAGALEELGTFETQSAAAHALTRWFADDRPVLLDELVDEQTLEGLAAIALSELDDGGDSGGDVDETGGVTSLGAGNGCEEAKIVADPAGERAFTPASPAPPAAAAAPSATAVAPAAPCGHEAAQARSPPMAAALASTTSTAVALSAGLGASRSQPSASCRRSMLAARWEEQVTVSRQEGRRWAEGAGLAA